MINFLLMFLPNKLRISFLRFRGAKIGDHCFIGACLISAKSIDIGDNVYIGHFNLIWRLDKLKLESGSRINNFNWVTGARNGSFYLGRNSAITRFHFLEASANIIIGNNSIIAGRNSHFFTHGISSTILDDMRPIKVGDWSYIGSSSRFVPGSEVPEGTFVGMGSVVTKVFDRKFTLIAGAPAVVKKEFGCDDPYFSRKYLPHDHHLESYSG